MLLATLLLATPVAHAQSASQARAFLDGIYVRDTNDNANPSLADRAKTYTTSLIRLFESDQRRAGAGNIGKLDYDPLCSCQDPEGISYRITSLSFQRVGKAKAELSLRQSPWNESLILDLLWTKEGWRIDDVHTKSVVSLRRFLQDR